MVAASPTYGCRCIRRPPSFSSRRAISGAASGYGCTVAPRPSPKPNQDVDANPNSNPSPSPNSNPYQDVDAGEDAPVATFEPHSRPVGG
eukprot:scaffold25659_cov59-Phaeocystis_antarctica.AAC.2